MDKYITNKLKVHIFDIQDAKILEMWDPFLGFDGNQLVVIDAKQIL